jgi:site-specific DNA-methyltransferase (adenine-specific)
MVQYDSIYLGNCISVLKTVPAGAAKLIATDPPFNIGLKYDLYDDKKDYRAYLAWCKEWLTECHRVLAPNGSIYVCIGDEYQAEINVLLKELGFYWRNTIIWYYTFGENQKNKFNRTHTVIHYFSKSSTEVAFYPDAVKVPSKRMLMGDKRAKAGGKIPDDVWESTSLEDHAPSALPADWTEWKMGVLNTVLRAGIKLNKAIDMVEEAAPSGVGDVWKISRVCGTFKERIVDENGSSHPCQMPSSVMERIIKASSVEGDLVIDPFCGTGTTADAAKRLGRRFLTMDVSEKYAKVAAFRLFGDESKYITL